MNKLTREVQIVMKKLTEKQYYYIQDALLSKFYEQENLQLNSNKAKKYLNWKPTYNIKQSVKFTTDWYFKVIRTGECPKKVTNDQIKKYMYDSKIY